jgi:Protein of unknown function (DUF4058)
MAIDRTKSPFPGMDPYLEQYWGDVHHRLCTYSCDFIRHSLPQGLIARIDEQTLIEVQPEPPRRVIPDVRVIEHGEGGEGGVAVMAPPIVADEATIIDRDDPIVEGFVQIIDTRSGGRVVTVIEFTSPANKAGFGRRKYLQKQEELLAAGVNLVEVDLIRSGPWIIVAPESKVAPLLGTFHVCVTRGVRIMRHEVYANRLTDRLPKVRIPLRPTDTDAILDLQAVMNQVYENGSYGYDVDYSKSPVPPLPQGEADWARSILAQREPAS